jgi:hypothetical protein
VVGVFFSSSFECDGMENQTLYFFSKLPLSKKASEGSNHNHQHIIVVVLSIREEYL